MRLAKLKSKIQVNGLICNIVTTFMLKSIGERKITHIFFLNFNGIKFQNIDFDIGVGRKMYKISLVSDVNKSSFNTNLTNRLLL